MCIRDRLLLGLLGVFGIHRIYMGKWLTGLVYLLTGGLFFVGVIYDILTLNEQLDEINVTIASPSYHFAVA